MLVLSVDSSPAWLTGGRGDSMDVRSLIKNYEGLRLTPYKDTMGYWTIGYGHCLDAFDEPVPERWTQQQADDAFEKEVQASIVSAKELAPNFDQLSDARQAVLIDMVFNMGKGGVAKFTHFLCAVGVGDFEGASRYMLESRWAVQVSHRAIRDSLMMRTGEWPNEST